MCKIPGKKFGDIDKIALNVLSDYGFFSFPLDVFSLAQKIGIRLIPYSKLSQQQFQRLTNNPSTFKGITCCKISKENQSIIFETFYNDVDLNFFSQRFTIAHEIKHVVSGDCFKDYLTEEDEILAEHFARNLLAPQCILLHQKSLDSKKICENHKISLQCAENCLIAINNRIEKYGEQFLFNHELDFIARKKNSSKYDQ